MLILSAFAGLMGGLIVQLPLTLFAGDGIRLADPQARALGTVWEGALAHIPGIPPVATRLEGRQVVFTAAGPELTLAGTAALDRIEDLSIALPVGALARFDMRLAGLSGTVRLTVDEILIADGACTSASGIVSTDVLATNAAQWGGWRGPNLSGPIACENGEIVLMPSGRDASGDVEARLTISPRGPYRTLITIRTNEPGAGAVLPLFGFEREGSGYRLSESGAWQ